jgi:hypothetical protein
LKKLNSKLLANAIAKKIVETVLIIVVVRGNANVTPIAKMRVAAKNKKLPKVKTSLPPVG